MHDFCAPRLSTCRSWVYAEPETGRRLVISGHSFHRPGATGGQVRWAAVERSTGRPGVPRFAAAGCFTRRCSCRDRGGAAACQRGADQQSGGGLGDRDGAEGVDRDGLIGRNDLILEAVSSRMRRVAPRSPHTSTTLAAGGEVGRRRKPSRQKCPLLFLRPVTVLFILAFHGIEAVSAPRDVRGGRTPAVETTSTPTIDRRKASSRASPRRNSGPSSLGHRSASARSAVRRARAPRFTPLRDHRPRFSALEARGTGAGRQLPCGDSFQVRRTGHCAHMWRHSATAAGTLRPGDGSSGQKRQDGATSLLQHRAWSR